MTEEQIALARRAVACRGWRWIPGMLAVEWTAPGMSLTGGRPFRVDDGWHEVGVYVPDLTDAATLGCLLALVREAWVYPSAQVAPMFTAGAGWLAYTNDDGDRDHRFYGVTEAEALVAALEAAP